jgi:glycosyltransferase involved in cell wall biosynthesis
MKKRLLVISSFHNPDKAVHAVDLWRSGRNIREWKKHETEWEIVERPTIMKFIKKYESKKDFTEKELEKTIADLADFDVVFGSYTAYMHPMVFALCKMVEDKFGTKFILDVDDNMFAVKQDNIGWWLYMDHDKTWDLQTTILKASYVTTTNEHLANVLRERREQKPDTVQIIPNYITLDYKNEPKTHEGIKIGYFGGSSHYKDLHNTGVIDAVRDIMNENKSVRFMSVGMPVESYLPRKRYTYNDGARGHAWITEIYPQMNFDIAIAPLTDDEFAKSKSNIKWQEASMMKAAVVATDVLPYQCIENGVDGILVKNGKRTWYEALKKLVDDEEYRKTIAQNAYDRIQNDYLIENNWQATRDAIENVYNA